jgi:hypothetical protein
MNLAIALIIETIMNANMNATAVILHVFTNLAMENV